MTYVHQEIDHFTCNDLMKVFVKIQPLSSYRLFVEEAFFND